MDFLIAGRYNELMKCDEPLRGSSNQELVLLSSKYKKEDFKSNIVEMVVNEDEAIIQITGFPESYKALDEEIKKDNEEGEGSGGVPELAGI